MNTRIVLLGGLLTVILAACARPAAPSTNAPPAIRVISPAEGATLEGPKVTLDVEVANWKFVDANQLPKDGEGHLHFFVDAPAASVKSGDVIPLDQKTTYVHAGKAPYGSREIELAPGQHTITVVMGNSAHQALASPAPVSVTFTVK